MVDVRPVVEWSGIQMVVWKTEKACLRYKMSGLEWSAICQSWYITVIQYEQVIEESRDFTIWISDTHTIWYSDESGFQMVTVNEIYCFQIYRVFW